MTDVKLRVVRPTDRLDEVVCFYQNGLGFELIAAFTELVATYGEEAVAEYAATLPDKIRSGAFSMAMSLKH